MKDNFAACLAHVLKYEGGWSDHPKDPGGATNYGITLRTYSAWLKRPASKAALLGIAHTEVAAIYRAEYWNAVRGDDLPPGLDLVAFDAAVNSGPSRAAKWLQTAVGTNADGKIGPATIAVAGRAGPDAIKRACATRMQFLRSLETWPVFGKGWSARVAATEALALQMSVQPRTDQNRSKTSEPGWLWTIINALRGSK